jgi:hypothetical protein
MSLSRRGIKGEEAKKNLNLMALGEAEGEIVSIMIRMII